MLVASEGRADARQPPPRAPTGAAILHGESGWGPTAEPQTPLTAKPPFPTRSHNIALKKAFKKLYDAAYMDLEHDGVSFLNSATAATDNPGGLFKAR